MIHRFASPMLSLSIYLHLWNLFVPYGRHAAVESKTVWCIVDFELREKGCSHGVRDGKSEEQIQCHHAFNAWKPCQKKKHAQEFWTDSRRARGIANHRKNMGGMQPSEEMDKLAQEDRIFKMAWSEYLRYSSDCSLQFNSSVSYEYHLYRNSEEFQKPTPPQEREKFSETFRYGARVGKKIGWRFWTFSSVFFKLMEEWSIGLERIFIKSLRILFYLFFTVIEAVISVTVD